jgi:hypothetical protein
MPSLCNNANCHFYKDQTRRWNTQEQQSRAGRQSETHAITFTMPTHPPQADLAFTMPTHPPQQPALA